MTRKSEREFSAAFDALITDVRNPALAKPALQEFIAKLAKERDPQLLAAYAQKLSQRLTGVAPSLIALGQHFAKSQQHAQAVMVLQSIKAEARTEKSDGLLAINLLALEYFRQAFQILQQYQTPIPENLYQVMIAQASKQEAWSEAKEIALNWVKQYHKSEKALRTLSEIYFQCADYDSAVTTFGSTLVSSKLNYADAVVMSLLALTAENYDLAGRYIEVALKFDAKGVQALSALAKLQKNQGSLSDCEATCQKILIQDPTHTETLTLLVEVKRGNVTDDQLTALVKAGVTTQVPDIKAGALYALGDCMDNRARHQEAFNYYGQANNLIMRVHNNESGFNPQQLITDARKLSELYSTGLFTYEVEGELIKPQPIFVVGTPRSGTTLIETVLARHSKVYPAGERRLMPAIQAEFLSVAREGDNISTKAFFAAQKSKWQKQYLYGIKEKSDKAFVVDKFVINYQSVPLILGLFPQATIVHICRAPIESCFSIYRNNFSKFWSFSQDQISIADYYHSYAQTIDLWQKHINSEKFITLHHNALVDNFENEAKNLVKVCGLDWEEQCLTPHQSAHAINTPSSVQVRHPISKNYVSRTGPYLEYLQPMIDRLQYHGIDPFDPTPFRSI